MLILESVRLTIVSWCVWLIWISLGPLILLSYEALAVLSSMGFRGQLLSLIQNCLSGGIQGVHVHDQLSCFRPVTSGMPQGSILGPILFISYISDLLRCVMGCEVFLHADDCKVSLSHPRAHLDVALMQSDLDNIVGWAGSMQLEPSIQKCQVLKIGWDQSQSVFTVLGNHLCASNMVNDLGILMDGWLSFDDQSGSVVRKASSVMNLIFRSFKCCYVVFLKRFFCSYAENSVVLMYD